MPKNSRESIILAGILLKLGRYGFLRIYIILLGAKAWNACVAFMEYMPLMFGKQFCRNGASKFQNSLENSSRSDNCTNLAGGGRQYQCSHFLLVLCNDYCRHKTETALHYSHILTLYCYVCAFPSDSHTISGRDWTLLLAQTFYYWM